MSKQSDENMTSRIPLYAAGLAVSAMGLYSLNFILMNPKFCGFALMLLIAGFTVSWMARAQVLPKSGLMLASLMILISLLAAVTTIPDFKYRLIPMEAKEEPDLLASVLLVWMIVGYSFRLTSDMGVLFLCVPSLSLFSLLATSEPSMRMLAYFAVFLGLTCFILVQQNSLSQPDRKARQRDTLRLRAQSIKVHIGISAGVTASAILIGLAVGSLFYPLIVRSFTARIADIDVRQIMEQIGGEEYVPVAAGPVNMSTAEVMTVKCDRPLLWRAKTFDTYTGQGWLSVRLPQEQSSVRAQRGTLDGERVLTFNLPSDPLSGEQPPNVETVEQTFRIISGTHRSMYAAAEPVKIMTRFRMPAIGVRGGLETLIKLQKDMEYTVISEVSRATPRQLSLASGDIDPAISARYLRLPESSWQIERITRRVIAGQTNSYSQAMAIQDFLEINHTYDANTPAAPKGEDPVNYFLLRSRRGYCDVFASAMVIMARQAGIPARWVTGYASGEFNKTERLWRVRGRDRHAWAELYFPGCGWVSFDPTPVAANITMAQRIMESLKMMKADRITLLAFASILLLVSYLLKVELLDRFIKPQHKTPSRPLSEVSRQYLRMCSMLSRHGLPRHPATTPYEYSSELRQVFEPQLEDLAKIVDLVTDDFVQYRYSGCEASPETTAAMADRLRSLGCSLKSARRQKLLPQQ